MAENETTFIVKNHKTIQMFLDTGNNIQHVAETSDMKTSYYSMLPQIIRRLQRSTIYHSL